VLTAHRPTVRLTTASILPAAVLACCLALHCPAQGTLGITFDTGSFVAPPGERDAISLYVESGMQFWNPYGFENLVSAGGSLSGYPEDGTAYLQVSTGARLGFTFASGTHFSLLSFDAAGYSTNVAGSITLTVVGYGDMGLRVTNNFTIDSLLDRRANSLPDFQRFFPDSRFADVYRVDIFTDRWSLDNVLLGGVPEPSAGTLALVGVLCGLACRRLSRWRKR
jgi:hypothetical protein